MATNTTPSSAESNSKGYRGYIALPGWSCRHCFCSRNSRDTAMQTWPLPPLLPPPPSLQPSWWSFSLGTMPHPWSPSVTPPTFEEKKSFCLYQVLRHLSVSCVSRLEPCTHPTCQSNRTAFIFLFSKKTLALITLLHVTLNSSSSLVLLNNISISVQLLFPQMSSPSPSHQPHIAVTTPLEDHGVSSCGQPSTLGWTLLKLCIPISHFALKSSTIFLTVGLLSQPDTQLPEFLSSPTQGPGCGTVVPRTLF